MERKTKINAEEGKQDLVIARVNNLHHTEPLIWSKVSHQSAQSEPPKKGGQIAEFRAN